MDDLVKALGMSGNSKSQVTRLCAEIDEQVQALLERSIERDRPYLWVDAIYLKAGARAATVDLPEGFRRGGRSGAAEAP